MAAEAPETTASVRQLMRRIARHAAAVPAAAGGPELSVFQQEAVVRAVHALDTHGGVLIADSVGLGKTRVALGIIDREAASNPCRVLVTAPAAIRGQWTRELRSLARARRLAFLSHTLPQTDGGWIGFASHAILNRLPDHILPDLVVADEAHAFRNPRTQRYRALARLCAGARVALLTATPVNNSLLDLYFQLRLFLSDEALAGVGVPDLADAFRVERQGHPTPGLERVFSAVIVRRTRRQLSRSATGFGVRFPERAPPVPIHYGAAWHRPVLDGIASLRFSAFATAGTDTRAGSAVPELIRLVLLKRLESSPQALLSSLRHMRAYLLSHAGSARAGRWLGPAHYRMMARAGAELAFDALVLPRYPPDRDAIADSAAAATDAGLIDKLVTIVESSVRQGDPKLRRLRELLATRAPEQKGIVFTEFRSTARALFDALAGRGRVALVDGGGARLASGPASRSAVVRRFAPVSNRAPPPLERERIDLLVATDVLAEGLNLQDAELIISYDLPWNPVRLVQRLGRIDRLGSLHERVQSFNFLPDRDLDRMLGLLDRIDAKLQAIRTSVGDGPGVLGGVVSRPGRVRPPVEKRDYTGVAEVVRRISRSDKDLFSDLELDSRPAVALEDRWAAALVAATRQASADQDTNLPIRLALRTDQVTAPTCLILATTGPTLSFVVSDDTGDARSDREFGMRVLLDALDLEQRESHEAPGPQLFDWDEALRVDGPVSLREVIAASLARVPEAAMDGRTPARVAASGGRLVRRLLTAAGRLPGQPDPATCARLDRVLASFGPGVPAGPATAIEEALRTFEKLLKSRTCDAETAHAAFQVLLDAVEGAFRSAIRRARPRDSAGLEILAILALVPP